MKQVGNTILAKGGNHILAKRDNSAWPKGSKLSGFSNRYAYSRELAFAADPEVTSYKLELIASRLGVELNDAHDAAADVTATLDILGIYTSRLRHVERGAITIQTKEKTRKHFKI